MFDYCSFVIPLPSDSAAVLLMAALDVRSACALDRLDLDSLRLIFDQLPLDDRLRCRCVSFNWRSTCSNAALWQRVFLEVSVQFGSISVEPAQMLQLETAFVCSQGQLSELSFVINPDASSWIRFGDEARLVGTETFRLLKRLLAASALRELRFPDTVSVVQAQELLAAAPGLRVLQTGRLDCTLSEAAQLPPAPLRFSCLSVTVPPAYVEGDLVSMLTSLEPVLTLRELIISSGFVPTLQYTPAVANAIGRLVQRPNAPGFGLQRLGLECDFQGASLADLLHCSPFLCLHTLVLQGKDVDEAGLSAALHGNSTLKRLCIFRRDGTAGKDDVWLPAVRACSSLIQFSIFGAPASVWVVGNRSPGSQPCPESFLAPCSPGLKVGGCESEPVPDATRCWHVRCSARSCKESVCTRHGHGDGVFCDNPSALYFFELHGCKADGCHRQFCEVHTALRRNCDVCCNGAVANSRLLGCPHLSEHGRCPEHYPIECRKFVSAGYDYSEEDDEEDEEKEEWDDDRERCGFYCCPVCMADHKHGDNPCDYT